MKIENYNLVYLSDFHRELQNNLEKLYSDNFNQDIESIEEFDINIKCNDYNQIWKNEIVIKVSEYLITQGFKNKIRLLIKMI